MTAPVANPAPSLAPDLKGIDQGLQLRDIHLPEPVSWWPPAPGWWLLAGLVILVIISALLLRRTYRRRRQLRRMRREIEHELAHIRAQFQQDANPVMLTRQLSELLRRAAISYYPHEHIAGLTGEHWLHFLAQTLTDKSSGLTFESNDARLLLTAPYLQDDALVTDGADIDMDKLIALCESWLLQAHRADRRQDGSPVYTAAPESVAEAAS